MAVIYDARGQVLDDLTQMLLRLTRKVEWKSDQRLAEWYQTRCTKTDILIRAFHDSLIVQGSEFDPVQKVLQLESLFAAQGGREALVQSCEEHLRHERQNWRPFARTVFVPLRSALLRLVEILPLQGSTATGGLLRFVRSLTSEASPHSDYLTIDGVATSTLPRAWHNLVHDHAHDKLAFNRRHLEVVAVLELATAIKAGEIFVSGALSFDRFWDRLPTDAADPAAIAAYSTARGWGDGAVGNDHMAYLRRGKHGRSIVTRLRAVVAPETAIDLEGQMMAHMPERAVLEAISNTEHWAQWGRHGLDCRLRLLQQNPNTYLRGRMSAR